MRIDLAISKPLISSGDSVVLSWTASPDVVALSIDQGIGPVSGLSGSTVVSNITNATIWTLTGTNIVGAKSTSSIGVAVTVTTTTYYNGLNVTYEQPEPTVIGTGTLPNVDLEYTGAVPPPFVYNAGSPNICLTSWSGKIIPRYTELYTFTFEGGNANTLCVPGNGAVSLVVNGSVVIASNTPCGGPCNPTSVSGTIALTAGVPVAFFAARDWESTDFYARLKWSSASQAQEVIPQSQFWYHDPTTSSATYFPITADLSVDNLTIYAGQSATLTWASTNATGATLNGSAVATSGNQVVSPTVPTTYTLSLTAPNCTTVTRQVSVNVLPLPVPTGLLASGTCSGVLLTWTPPAVFTSFIILRDNIPIGTSSLPSYVDVPPSPWVAHSYTVQTVNNAVTSTSSDPATASMTAVLSAVVGLTATPSRGNIVLAWTPVDHAISYRLYRGISSDYLALVKIGIVGNSIVDAVSSDQPYFYAVSALGPCGESALSAVMSSTALPVPSTDWK